MEFQRGERVNLNFDTGGVEKLEPEDDHAPPLPVFPTFVGDILERESVNPPVAPSLTGNVKGFPAHKKRTPRVSAFKQQRAAKAQEAAEPNKPSAQNDSTPRAPRSTLEQEKQSIDEENRNRLAAMSDDEIEQERQELMQSLNPALLQRLLARSNIDDGSNERDLHEPEQTAPLQTSEAKIEPEPKPRSPKEVSFAEPEPKETKQVPPPPISEPTPEDPQESIHFPRPPQPPDLDPNDPNFLKNLHDKYFPTLPYDPSSLSWMSPIDPNDTSSPYHPSQTALNASELRFDFKGALLPPSVARSLPTDRGLHHHADAPEAAGYTIPELAVLSRSAVPAQRCMAYQTLGRILYRLGQGEFGVEKGRKEEGNVRVVKNPNVQESEDEDEDEEDAGSAMAAGLWGCIEAGYVIETLTEEANKTRGHLTARTFAQEALWNWRRGGGRKRQAV